MVQVDAIVDNISQASTEQVGTITQINQDIKHLENDTITYSTMAEETSSAAANISEQADALEQSVQRFVIEKTSAKEGNKRLERSF